MEIFRNLQNVLITLSVAQTELVYAVCHMVYNQHYYVMDIVWTEQYYDVVVFVVLANSTICYLSWFLEDKCHGELKFRGKNVSS